MNNRVPENIMTDEPLPGLYWGRDIARPRALQPPSDIIPYLQGLATGLNGFAAQRRRSIEYYIDVFELDKASFQQRRRNRRGTVTYEDAINQDSQPGEDGYLKPYNINKALTLELMTTCVMYRLLSPTCARANCVLVYGWPVNFAPPGHHDIRVDCGEFVFHVEVSAKDEMNDAYFYDELKGTLNHMVKHEVNWALLVTEWDYKKARNSQAYKDFKNNNQAELDHRHLIIMSIQEMAELSATLGFDAEYNSGRKRLNPIQVRELFVALHAAQEPVQDANENP